MAKLAVATYSVKSALKDDSIGLEGIIEFLHNNNVKHVEINNIFTKPEKLGQMVANFKESGITPFQLTIDGNNFFQKKESKQQKQFEFMKKWIDPAHEAGIKYVRANMGHRLGFLFPTDKLEYLVKTFRPIMDYIEEKNMIFVFENHGGKSSDVEFQLKVKHNISSKNFGYLLDTGNYKPKEEVYENILKLGKSIKVVHAKTYDFDENGEETTLDFGKIISNLQKVDYDGYYSVEFEGRNLGDIEGTKKTLKLLRKHL